MDVLRRAMALRFPTRIFSNLTTRPDHPGTPASQRPARAAGPAPTPGAAPARAAVSRPGRTAHDHGHSESRGGLLRISASAGAPDSEVDGTSAPPYGADVPSTSCGGHGTVTRASCVTDVIAGTSGAGVIHGYDGIAGSTTFGPRCVLWTPLCCACPDISGQEMTQRGPNRTMRSKDNGQKASLGTRILPAMPSRTSPQYDQWCHHATCFTSATQD